MTELVVCVMGENHRDLLEVCLKSVQGADHLLYVDGGSTDDSRELAKSLGAAVIEKEFDQENKYANPEQRNFYLKHLQEHYSDCWVLCLDADEVVDDILALKKWIAATPAEAKNALYSVHMRHLVYNFRYEDNTRDHHYVPNRLFYLREGLHYPLGEHLPLKDEYHDLHGVCDAITIWHLAYSTMLHVRSRYRKNLKHSAVHSKPFLDNWYRSHLFGAYPIKQLHPKELPRVLLEGYDIDPDEFYFADRGLETKHFIDAAHWKRYFNLTPTDGVLEWGCGLGPRIVAMRTQDMNAYGIELSKWAVEHSLAHGFVGQGDITKNTHDPLPCKLAIAYDLLEHIPYELLNNAIDNLIQSTNKYLLISVPVLGDPNLEADPTHIIKETKEWWKEQFTKKGCKEITVPEYFQYREQLMIFEVQLGS